MKRAVVMFLLLAGAALAGGSAARSPAVYPPQVLPLSFSHARHQARQAMPCVRCHPAAITSARTADNLLPGQAACEPCHAIGEPARADKASGACELCHPGWDGKGQPPRLVVPEAALRFSHALHAGARIDCQRCHGSLAQVGLATRADLPSMADCQSCHDGRQQSGSCVTCHPATPSGQLITSLPGGQLVPRDHGSDFERTHGRQAQLGSDCQSCHGEAFCTSCHDGKEKPLTTHAGDYQRAHAVDARKDSKACQGCHRVETFCTGCHARTGVMPDRKTSTFPPRRDGAPAGSPQFHPPDFDTTHGGPARRNLLACASCHREDYCASCHRGPMASSPHGPAWRGSSKCEAIRARNARVCLRCHLDDRGCSE